MQLTFTGDSETHFHSINEAAEMIDIVSDLIELNMENDADIVGGNALIVSDYMVRKQSICVGHTCHGARQCEQL